MHFGDSHVAADVLTREIRDRFQNEFGDGGPALSFRVIRWQRDDAELYQERRRAG